MKFTELKFARRFNLGNYEHAEYTVTAVVDDDESPIQALNDMKNTVNLSQKGDITGVAAVDSTKAEEAAPAKPAKKPKKNKPAPKEEAENEEELNEEENEEIADGEEFEEEEVSEEDASEESEDEDSESEEENEEEVVETKPAKKPVKASKKLAGQTSSAKTPATATASPGKKFKSKAAAYNRNDEIHKKLFGEMTELLSPGWRKKEALKVKVKNISTKMEKKDFLDATGAVLPAFRAEVKTLLKAK